MKEKLSYDEITKVIAKLREEYDRLSKEMDQQLFDRPSFEKRYLEALKNKIDMQTFAFAEMTALEDKKALFEKRQREIKIRTDKVYTKKVDKMIEDMAEKTRKYPFLYEDSGISEESGRLCGALDKLYYDQWIPLDRIVEQDDLKNRSKYDILTRDYLRYIGQPGRRVPLEIDRYMTDMETNGDEKADRHFLKEAAIFLSDVIKFLQDLQDFRFPDDILSFPGSQLNPSPFNGLTRSQAWDLVGKSFSELIDDFRFSELI